MVANAMRKVPTHRRVKISLTLVTAGLVSLATAGCAPMSEVAQEEREFENVDFENQFIAYRQRCMASGGRVYVLANDRVDRRGIPSRGSYYTCS